MFIVVSSLVLRLDAPVHKLDIKYRGGFVFLTGPVTPLWRAIKNPPAQPSGLEFLRRFSWIC
jgi:hypothetical protein